MRRVDYTYTICGVEGAYYVVLHDADNGIEAGYMRQDGTPITREDLKQIFETREEAGETASKWGHTL